MSIKKLKEYTEKMLLDAELSDIDKELLLRRWIDKTEESVMSTVMHSSELFESTKYISYMRLECDKLANKTN